MRTTITAIAAFLVPVTLLADPQCDGGCCQKGGCCQTSRVRPKQEKADMQKDQSRGSVERGMSTVEHDAIHDLLSHHDEVQRRIEQIPNGVRTTTTTTNPELIETLRTHVRQMAQHVKDGRPVRMWDPVFQGIFSHHDEIKLSFKDIDKGIQVTETSPNPEVVPLIRAHAEKVNSFVAEGHSAARPPWAGGGRGRMNRGR